MNPRLAIKETIKIVLINNGMDADVAASAADKMHDDHTFLEGLEQFFQDHIEDFGENYGL